MQVSSKVTDLTVLTATDLAARGIDIPEIDKPIFKIYPNPSGETFRINTNDVTKTRFQWCEVSFMVLPFLIRNTQYRILRLVSYRLSASLN